MTASSLVPNHRTTEISLAATLPADCAVLIVATTTDDGELSLIAHPAVNFETTAELLATLQRHGATGELEETLRVPAPEGCSAESVLAVGLGDEGYINAETVRLAAGAAVRALTGVCSAASTLSAINLTAALEGGLLGSYQFAGFRSTEPKPGQLPLGELVVLTPSGEEPSEAEAAELEVARAITEAMCIARDFVNTPPSHLYPESFAAAATELATAAGLEVEVLDDTQLAEAGYGGLMAVGSGSSRGPRLVRLRHAGKGGRRIALVGKGITFDTGGISIKPSAGMAQMTSDMGGAAGVIGAILAAAALDVDAEVIAYAPMAENMPSSTAYRPGDVITHYGGRTTEVLNTDAEGRLILADAIARASEDEPDFLIDTATLTGAQLVALGTRTPGVMGDQLFAQELAALSEEVGEHGWAMPLPQELAATMKSPVADMANISSQRWGGMLSAAVFLREFVGNGITWAHIDVAGPAYNAESAYGYYPAGGTGSPVRTLLAAIEEYGPSDTVEDAD